MGANLRGSFALSCSGSTTDLASVDAPADVTFAPGSAFTVGATFLVQGERATCDVVRQEGIFSLGLTAGVPAFSAAELGTFECDASVVVGPGVWTQLVAVSDGANFTLYQDGLAVLEAPLQAPAAAGGTDADSARWQMGAFPGYLSEAFADARAMTGQEVLAQSYAANDSVGALSLYADFQAYQPADRGKSGLPLQLAGSCMPVDLVTALVPGRSGYAVAPRTSKCLKALSSGSFTVYANVFTKPSAAVGDTCLYACCELADNALPEQELSLLAAGSASGMRAVLTLGIADHATTPYVQAGGTRLTSDVKLEPSRWASIAVTVQGTDVTLYVEGEVAAHATLPAPVAPSMGCEQIIGAGVDGAGRANGAFGGYIDAVAVFQGALAQDALKTFAQVPPFIFDNSCAALWQFSYDAPLDLKSFRSISLAGDARVESVQNTLRTVDLPEFAFKRPSGESGLTDMQAWQADAAAQVLFGVVRQAFGLDPTQCVVAENSAWYKPESTAKDVAWDVLVPEKAAQELVTTGTVAPATVTETLAEPAVSSCASALVETFYGTQTLALVGGLTRLKTMLMALSQSSYVRAYAVTALAAATAAALASWASKHRSPEAGDDTETEDGVQIRLETVQFYTDENAEKGSVCTCADFGAQPALPEWKRKERSGAVAYARVEESAAPKVTATFVVDSVKSTTAVRVKATAFGEDRLLGDLDERTINVTGAGTYTVDFPLSHHKLKAADAGAHKVAFQWYADTSLLGSTDHTVYALYARPLAPWSAVALPDPAPAPKPGVASHIVPETALKLAGEVLSQEATAADDDRRFCERFVTWVQSNPKLAGAAFDRKPSFAGWDAGFYNVTCDVPRFVEAYANAAGGSVVELSALDCSLLGLALARAVGLQRVRAVSVTTEADTGPLTVRNARPFGPSERKSAFAFTMHFALAVGEPLEGCDPRNVYDAYLVPTGPDGTELPAKGLPFTLEGSKDFVVEPSAASYRDLVCAPGVRALLGLSVKNFLVGHPPVTSIIFVPHYGFTAVSSSRPPFNEETRAALPLENAAARCHAVSFNSIQKLIAKSLTAFSADVGELKKALCLLVRAVYRDAEGYPGVPQPKQGSDEGVVCAGIQEVLTACTNADGSSAAHFATGLLDVLNNAVQNLRVASLRWNSRVQSACDLTGWCHFVETDEGFFQDATEEGPEWTQSTTVSGYPIVGPGFYVSDPGDWVMLTFLGLLMGKLQNSDIVLIKQNTMCVSEEEAGRNPNSNPNPRFLVSSSNAWSPDHYRILYLTGCVEPIYYQNALSEESEWRAWGPWPEEE